MSIFIKFYPQAHIKLALQTIHHHHYLYGGPHTCMQKELHAITPLHKQLNKCRLKQDSN